MLHLITCHGRIMSRLAELLFFDAPATKRRSVYSFTPGICTSVCLSIAQYSTVYVSYYSFQGNGLKRSKVRIYRLGMCLKVREL